MNDDKNGFCDTEEDLLENRSNCSVCEECGYEEAKPGAAIRPCLCPGGNERSLCMDCLNDCNPYKSY